MPESDHEALALAGNGIGLSPEFFATRESLQLLKDSFTAGGSFRIDDIDRFLEQAAHGHDGQVEAISLCIGNPEVGVMAISRDEQNMIIVGRNAQWNYSGPTNHPLFTTFGDTAHSFVELEFPMLEQEIEDFELAVEKNPAEPSDLAGPALVITPAIPSGSSTDRGVLVYLNDAIFEDIRNNPDSRSGKKLNEEAQLYVLSERTRVIVEHYGIDIWIDVAAQETEHPDTTPF